MVHKAEYIGSASDSAQSHYVFHCPRCGYEVVFDHGEPNVTNIGDGSQHYGAFIMDGVTISIDMTIADAQDDDDYNKLFGIN